MASTGLRDLREILYRVNALKVQVGPQCCTAFGAVLLARTPVVLEWNDLEAGHAASYRCHGVGRSITPRQRVAWMRGDTVTRPLDSCSARPRANNHTAT